MECYKQYKDAQPQETIKKIKSILSSLDIKTHETLFDVEGLFYSCRIEIDNYGLESLGIGTNGKGMTPDYALASGYAELMERLQNKFLVNEALRYSAKIPNGKTLSFRFFPDEKLQVYTIHDFFKLIKELFPNYDTEHSERSCYKSKAVCEPDMSDNWWGQLANVEFLGVPFVRFRESEQLIENVPIILARANSSTGL